MAHTVAVAELEWEVVKSWFAQMRGNEFLPDGYISDTSVAMWQLLLDHIRERGWLAGQPAPPPSAAEFLAQGGGLGAVTEAGFAITFRPWSALEIMFDVDLRGVDGQQSLDDLCALLRSLGRLLGRPVRVTPEGMGVAEPFLGYEPSSDKVVLLAVEPPIPHALRTPATFAQTDNWHGGFYELAVEIGPTGDDEALDLALRVLWDAIRADGCYADRQKEPEQQQRLPATLETLLRHGHLLGRVNLPEGATVLCGALAVREEEGSDWLDFYLPLGALCRADSRVDAYPFAEDDHPSLPWRRPIDTWLAEAAAQIYRAVPYRLGLIGFEVSGQTHASELASDPPSPRGIGYLLPSGGALRYLAAEC